LDRRLIQTTPQKTRTSLRSRVLRSKSVRPPHHQ
jgi:hypothetical protein